MDEFTLQSNGQTYLVKTVGQPDNTMYAIYQDKYLFTIGLNENAEWEATENVDPVLVRELGTLIDHKFA